MTDDGRPTMRLGLLPLTDAAPAVLAEARGLFAAEGVAVTLSVEPSWANIADKLAFGLLDGAVMLPPLALAMTLGLRRAAAALLVPMGLSLNGNSVVLAGDLADRLPDIAAPALAVGGALRGLLAGRKRPRLAVVHAWSTHDLLLRYWLAASGIDPERDVALSVLPPSDMPRALLEGRIDGFCAGAPWGAVAARAGAGRAVVLSSSIWRNHPEKCFAVRAAWAERHPEALQSVLRALLRAGVACDDPAVAPEVAGLLAGADRVGVSADLIAASLPGGSGDGVDQSVFARHAAAVPWRSQARWFVGQMGRWSDLPADAASRAAAAYRPDLHAEAARRLGLNVPLAGSKREGGHASCWTLPGDAGPIAMLPDPFCDAACFEGS
jgi:NitT/TauT family transport system ATP-binding protein/nitrate/nitrite transport system substrate-binding protein